MQRRIETKSKISRFLTTLSCILFGVFIIYNNDKIKLAIAEDVIPYIHQYMSRDREEIVNINTSFNKMLSDNKEIDDVVLYKFIPDSDNGDLIKGQMGITVQSRSGNTLEEGLYTISHNKQAFQEILLNKVHFENVTALRSECDEFFNHQDTFTCKKVKHVQIAYKTIITIPISDDDGYSVVGYILLTLNREYDNEEVTSVVRGVQTHIPQVKASLFKI